MKNIIKFLIFLKSLIIFLNNFKMAYAEFDIVYWDVEDVEYTRKIVGMYISDYKIDDEEEPRRATIAEPAYIVEMDDEKKYIVDHGVLNPEKSWKSNNEEKAD